MGGSMKKAIIAIVLVFVAWSLLDFVLHGILLQGMYQATASMWRPMEEMKHGLMSVVTLISATVFVMIYTRFVTKSLANAIQYGVLYGLGTGIGMGYGTYSVQPLPYFLAMSWFLGCIVEAAIAGVILGYVVKE